jgi:hypothetical protein
VGSRHLYIPDAEKTSEQLVKSIKAVEGQGGNKRERGEMNKRTATSYSQFAFPQLHAFVVCVCYFNTGIYHGCPLVAVAL